MPNEIVDLLKLYKTRNQDNMQKCLQLSLKNINDKCCNRAFDDFPLLINQPLFDALKEDFLKLLKSSSHKSIRDFEMRLVNIACNRLFDNNGNISAEIINEMGWNGVTEKLDNYNLTRAFTNLMNSHLFEQCNQAICENQNLSNAIITYITNNYSAWVLGALRHRGIKYDPKFNQDQVTPYDVLSYPIRNPGFTASFLVGGVLGLAVYGGVKIISNAYDEYAEVKPQNNLQP